MTLRVGCRTVSFVSGLFAKEGLWEGRRLRRDVELFVDLEPEAVPPSTAPVRAHPWTPREIQRDTRGGRDRLPGRGTSVDPPVYFDGSRVLVDGLVAVGPGPHRLGLPHWSPTALPHPPTGPELRPHVPLGGWAMTHTTLGRTTHLWSPVPYPSRMSGLPTSPTVDPSPAETQSWWRWHLGRVWDGIPRGKAFMGNSPEGRVFRSPTPTRPLYRTGRTEVKG